MPLQFAPPPSFAEPKNLVPEIKLPSVQRPNIPLRNLSTVPDDDDKTRDMMLAMILGASTPLFERGAVALAEKIPGISGLLEPKEVEQPQLSGAERLNMLREKAKELYPEDAIARQGWVKGQQVANAAIPDSPRPLTDTMMKSAVKMLGGLAPAAALKTSAGAGVFADMYGRRIKAKSDSALQDAKDRLDTIKARKDLAGNVSKKYFESQQEALFHFIDPLTMERKTRNVVRVGEDIFVKSQGDATIDVDLKGEPVPRGKTYINPLVTGWGTTEAKPVDVHGTYMNLETRELATGRLAHSLNPDTQTWEAKIVVDPRGDEPEQFGGDDWVKVPDNTLLSTMIKQLSNVDPTIVKQWTGMWDRDTAVGSTLFMLSRLQELVSKNRNALTDVSTLKNVWNELNTNMEAIAGLFGDSPLDTFNSTNQYDEPFYNKEEVGQTLELYKALQNYRLDTNNKRAEGNFINAMERWTDRVNDKYSKVGNWGNAVGSLKTYDKQELIARAQIISRQLQLAYRAATTSGQTGRTLSDKDLAHFLQVVGYGIQDADILIPLQAEFARSLLGTIDGTDNPFKHQIDNSVQTKRYVTNVLNVDTTLFNKAQIDDDDGAIAREKVHGKIANSTAGVGSRYYAWRKKIIDKQSGKAEWQLIMLPFRDRFYMKGEKGAAEFVNALTSPMKTGTGTRTPLSQFGANVLERIRGRTPSEPWTPDEVRVVD